MVEMDTSNHVAVAKAKGRRSAGPRHLKRVLHPRAISKAGRWVSFDSRRLNSKFCGPVQNAKGGAPKGNANALRHGRFTRAMIARRALFSAELWDARALHAEIEAMLRLLQPAAALEPDVRDDR
jgi:hypothetical protein